MNQKHMGSTGSPLERGVSVRGNLGERGRSPFRFFSAFRFLLIAACLLFAGRTAWGQKDATDAAPSPGESVEKAAPSPAFSPISELKVPEVEDVAALIGFCQELRQNQPADSASEAERRAHFTKVYQVRMQAAKKALALKPTGNLEVTAHAILGESLIVAGQLGQDTRRELSELISELMKRESSDLQKLAVELRVADYDPSSVADTDNVVRELEAAGEKFEVDAYFVRNWLIEVIVGLNQLPEDAKSAKLAERIAAIAKKSTEEKLVPLVEQMEGVARRLNLPGNEMKVEGVTLDDKAFNIDQWKGKVILVDFWATWCGPCVEELPNVLESYQLYHDKGFEVIGINIDKKRSTVERFVEANNIPWPQLHEEAKNPGDSHPLVKYYGVFSFPTVMLIDQKGKVVSQMARGDELRRLLSELLGPPSNAKKTSEASQQDDPPPKDN